MFDKPDCVWNTEASTASAEYLASGRILDILYRPCQGKNALLKDVNCPFSNAHLQPLFSSQNRVARRLKARPPIAIMVIVIETHTEPINPPSASPIITHAQMWDGIIHGLCNNHLLVETINSVKVLSHTEEELVLSQMLDDHTTIGHKPGEHKNTFKLSPPSKVSYTHIHTYKPIQSIN